jgi:hypothetical protein
MAMTISEIAERGFSINEYGIVLDDQGNEHRDENGLVQVMRPDYQELLEADNVLLYGATADGQWTLYLVLSHAFMAYNPDFLRDFYSDEENFLCVASDDLDLPVLYSDEN